MKSDFAKFEKKTARVNLQRLMAGRVPGLSPNPQGQGLYQQPVQQNQQQIASPLPKMKKPMPKFKRPAFPYKRPVMAKRPVGGLMMRRPPAGLSILRFSKNHVFTITSRILKIPTEH